MNDAGGTASSEHRASHHEEPGNKDNPESEKELIAHSLQIRDSSWVWIRAAAVLVAFYVGYQCLLIVLTWVGALGQVLLLAIFAVVIALMVEPVVRFLDRRFGWPRGLASISVILGLYAFVGLLMYVTYIPVKLEVTSFIHHLPAITRIVESDSRAIQNLMRQHGVKVSLTQFVPEVGSFIENLVPSVLSGTVGVIVDLVLLLVLSFWFLKDGELLRAGFTTLFPQKIRSEVDFLSDTFSIVIGGYVRAQLLTAFLLGILATAGCALIGVPYPLIVGVTVSVFELIPLVGPIAGVAVACLLALTKSPGLVLWTVIVFVVIHIIEAYVVTPRLQGHFVHVHPVVIMLSIVAGVEIGGFLGALFAVPIVSFASVLIQVWIGGLKEQRPDLFKSRPDKNIERSRRQVLREFRLFKH